MVDLACHLAQNSYSRERQSDHILARESDVCLAVPFRYIMSEKTFPKTLHVVLSLESGLLLILGKNKMAGYTLQ